MHTRLYQVAAVAAVCVIVMFAASAGAQSEGAARQARPAKEKMPPKVVSVRFEVTVFRVAVPSDKIVALDAKALAAEGVTPAKLAEVLQGFGKTEVLYRIDQGAAVGDRQRNRTTVAKSTPYVSGTTMTSAGQLSTSVHREKVGGKFEFRGHFPDETNKKCIQAAIDIEISVMSSSSLEVQKGVTAPVFWEVEQSYGGLMELGQPVVLLSVDGAATTGAEEPLAFVSLVSLSEP